MQKDHFDQYPDAKKENWNGIMYLFILPSLIVFSGIVLFRILSSLNTANHSVALSPQIGVGGAPPTAIPQRDVEQDFMLYEHDVTKNRISGYLNKDLYDLGGRVYSNIVVQYSQVCKDGQNAHTESQDVTLTKNADTYSSSVVRANGLDWRINATITISSSLCQQSGEATDMIRKHVTGRVYVSADNGKSVMLNPKNSEPYEIKFTQ